RFSPGTLTNPSYREFYEPDVVLVVDPLIDRQAIEEAKKRRVPIVGLCGTVNDTSDIDFVVPINNNSKKSLALFFWILARGILKAKGKIKKDGEFKATLKDFGDVAKPKKTAADIDLNLGGGLDVDIDIEIETKDSKEIEKAKPKEEAKEQ
ncbi:MAG TPA: 30S ribosomal protein S2, partial [archaeon]|nr:30S ribosomal protein S2 [archaeon]